jgi:hypothetical protein
MAKRMLQYMDVNIYCCRIRTKESMNVSKRLLCFTLRFTKQFGTKTNHKFLRILERINFKIKTAISNGELRKKSISHWNFKKIKEKII